MKAVILLLVSIFLFSTGHVALAVTSEETVIIRNAFSNNAHIGDSGIDSIDPPGVNSGLASRFGSTFRLTESAKVSRLEVSLLKTNTPTAIIEARIYASTGPFGGLDDEPTGSILVTSSNTIDSSSITTSLLTYRFNFPSASELASGTSYAWVLVAVSGSADDTNEIRPDRSAAFEGNPFRYVDDLGGSPLQYTTYSGGDYGFLLYGVTSSGGSGGNEGGIISDVPPPSDMPAGSIDQFLGGTSTVGLLLIVGGAYLLFFSRKGRK